jgi:hypothetical protein
LPATPQRLPPPLAPADDSSEGDCGSHGHVFHCTLAPFAIIKVRPVARGKPECGATRYRLAAYAWPRHALPTQLAPSAHLPFIAQTWDQRSQRLQHLNRRIMEVEARRSADS